MMDRYVEAANISSAWVEAVSLILGEPRSAAVHLAVRISHPTTEDDRVRALVDGLLDELGKPPVATVRNTIFPAAMATRFPDPESLSAHYREKYPTIRRFPGNRDGTYFGRMVDLPAPDGVRVDQLANLVEKLRFARAKSRGPLSSRYEVNIGMAGVDVNVYASSLDRSRLMGFPCLSHCSFHIADDCVHLGAHYRNQYMIERAYGNYVGLGELLGYVARSTGFGVGELLVVAGHASIDSGGKRRLRRLLDEARTAMAQVERDTPSRVVEAERPKASTRRRSRR